MASSLFARLLGICETKSCSQGLQRSSLELLPPQKMRSAGQSQPRLPRNHDRSPQSMAGKPTCTFHSSWLLIHVLFSLHQPRSRTHKDFFKKRTWREQWRTVAFINFGHQLAPRLLTYPRSLIVPRSSVQLLSYFGVVVAAGIRVVILRETHNLISGLWF